MQIVGVFFFFFFYYLRKKNRSRGNHRSNHSFSYSSCRGVFEIEGSRTKLFQPIREYLLQPSAHRTAFEKEDASARINRTAFGGARGVHTLLNRKKREGRKFLSNVHSTLVVCSTCLKSVRESTWTTSQWRQQEEEKDANV